MVFFDGKSTVSNYEKCVKMRKVDKNTHILTKNDINTRGTGEKSACDHAEVQNLCALGEEEET